MELIKYNLNLKILLKYKKLLILFIIIFSFNSGEIMSKQDVNSHTLDNGLKIFFINDPSASLVSVRTYVQAGSVTEGEYLGSGISHYLEHMVAGGATTKRSEQEYKDLISRLGGAFNAYTTSDHTSYYINTTAQEIKKAVTVLYEWMFFCEFTEREYKREQSVIIKEIEKNNANVARNFYQLCQNNFYKYHPVRFPIIGYLENFKRINRSDLIKYYKKYYVPGNMVLVIGGNFNNKKVFDHINKTFGSIKPLADIAFEPFEEPKPFSPRSMEKEGDTQITYFSIRFSTTDLFSDDLYALDLLDFILGNGEESILYKRLVDTKKLAYSINCTSYTPAIATGYFDITLEIDYKNKEKVKKEVFDILEEIKAGKINEFQIKRAKKQKISEDILSITTIEDKVSRIGQSYIYGHSKNFFEHYVNKFRTVTKSDVVEIASKYIVFDRAIFTTLKPKDKLSKKKETSSNKVSKKVILPEKITLPNGVRIILYPEKSLPRTYAKIFVAGGIRAENSKNNGIGALTADLLGKGSEKYDKYSINRLVEDNGAALYASLGNNTLYYNLDCLAEDFTKLFPLMIHTFLKPTFNKDELMESRRQISKVIKQRKESWFSYGSYKVKKTFFKNHPYGLSRAGEINSIKNISTDDINSYFNNLLNPENTVITVFGDYNKDIVLQQIKKSFSSLNRTKQHYDPGKVIERKLHSKTELHHNSIDQDVAALFIVYDGSSFIDKHDEFKFDLLDSTLSGMSYPGGRLHNLLREKGLVYVVHAGHNPGIEKGYFLIYALTSSDKIDTVKKLILEQIEDIKSKPVQEDEFKNALAQLKYYYQDKVSATSMLSIITATDELYGRKYDYYTQSDKQIDSLTLSDIQKTADQYLNNPQIFIFEKK